MHDFFVRQDDETLVLECEGGKRAEDLMKKMKPFKLRAKVELSVEPEVSVYAVFGAEQGYARSAPRRRWVLARPSKPEGFEENCRSPHGTSTAFCLGIPDGSRDMAVDKDTVLECNIDKLSGASFEKGCYVGQEITARMHLRGLV